MSKLSKLRPSPALIVAMAALVMAMSGAAIALPGKNTVKKNDIANGAVTSKKIAKNAVKSKQVLGKSLKGNDLRDKAVKAKQIADETITGAQVENESLSDEELNDYAVLGSSATRVVATEAATEAAARAAAPETVLLEKAPFTLYAKCYRDTTAGETFGTIYSRTSVDGAIQEGFDELPAGAATALLNTGTPEDDRELDEETVATANEGSVGEAEGALIAPDLTAIHVNTYIAVKQGTLPTGNGAFGDGNVCLFGGSATG